MLVALLAPRPGLPSIIIVHFRNSPVNVVTLLTLSENIKKYQSDIIKRLNIFLTENSYRQEDVQKVE